MFDRRFLRFVDRRIVFKGRFLGIVDRSNVLEGRCLGFLDTCNVFECSAKPLQPMVIPMAQSSDSLEDLSISDVFSSAQPSRVHSNRFEVDYRTSL